MKMVDNGDQLCVGLGHMASYEEVGSHRAPRLVYILRECGRENKGLTRKQAQLFTCEQGKASQVKKKSNMDITQHI